MQTDQPPPEVARETSAERLLLFSDAVLAIALTLLALDLPQPDGHTNAAILHSVFEQRWDYLTFLISFVVIAAHWRAHHRVFHDVVTLGGQLTGLNMWWLLTQVITPFATKMLTTEGGFEVRFAFYALVQVVSSVLFIGMVTQIRKYDLHHGTTPQRDLWVSVRRSAILAVAFLVSIPVVFLVSRWAYLCWAVLPSIGDFVERRVRQARAA